MNRLTALLDLIRLVGAMLLAFTIICGGGAFLWATKDATVADVHTLQLAVAGMMGSAMTWVFSQESGARATRAAHESRHI